MLLNQYFGQYLLNKGILRPEQLSEAIVHEHSVKIKLGVLAINSGFMNALQVESVHALQKSQDKKFGELALEMGCLTVGQLEELLEVQRNRQMSLSQAIVDLGFLDLAMLEQVLEDYRRESNLTGEQWEALNGADFEQAAHAFLDFSAAGGIGEIYYNYVALFLRNIVRFISDNPVIQQSSPVEEYRTPDWLITQNVTGEISLSTALALDDAALLEFARRFSQEDLVQIDELAEGSVAEFFNVVNGVFCVNASDQCVNLDLQPQSIAKGRSVKLSKGYRIPIQLEYGKAELILAERVLD